MAKRKKYLNQDQNHLFESLNIMENGEMIHVYDWRLSCYALL